MAPTPITCPILAIRGQVCFRCLKHPLKLLRCSGCQLVHYCSKKCQKLDWKTHHRGLCKVLAMNNEKREQDEKQEKTWDEYRKATWNSLKAGTYDRDEQTFVESLDECQLGDWVSIVLAQPCCIGCHQTRFPLFQQGLTLDTCETCRFVTACSRCSKDHSESLCQEARLMTDVALRKQAMRRKDLKQKIQAVVGFPIASPRTLAQYRPLQTFGGWNDFLQEVPLRYDESEPFDDIITPAMATDCSSMTVTIVASLEHARTDLLDKEQLLLHIIGASALEVGRTNLFEDVLHLLPPLKRLHIVFVGPNANVSIFGPSYLWNANICPACLHLGRQFVYSSVRGTYQDYVGSSDYRKPDLAVIFNSGDSDSIPSLWGLVDKEPAAPITSHLLDSSTLTLRTTYTKLEATEEVQELDNLGANFVMRPEQNKWRGMVPAPEIIGALKDEDVEEHAFWYQNNFWYIFEGSKGQK
ncbi:zinc finger mynd domain-containing protein 17 [Zymoseptoria brevis]|uniref:Zinc finger mynd domain-containing protein 17 n=1 Tax=Zymoseptoria brevis TaxID=1047168 RepID=A0A0F4GJG5_9PEZI|nr:zinc finger mynd domain-containing protein 17 [Zymoseptoria brevis]